MERWLNMKKLIIIRGNSGSGKSTLAREIHKKLARNNLLISQDTIRRDMLRAKDGKDTGALPLLENLLEYGHNNCEITILEGILNANGIRHYSKNSAFVWRKY